MQPRIIGKHPLAKDANGKLQSRIATVFPYDNTVVTLPGIHATQRMAYVDLLDKQRLELGLGPLTREEEADQWQTLRRSDYGGRLHSHRPDPDNMEAAFRADELLQQFGAEA